MKVSTLAKVWEKTAKARLTSKGYTLHLPIEDVGPTPRFLDLSKKYMALITQDQKAANG